MIKTYLYKYKNIKIWEISVVIQTTKPPVQVVFHRDKFMGTRKEWLKDGKEERYIT